MNVRQIQSVQSNQHKNIKKGEPKLSNIIAAYHDAMIKNYSMERFSAFANRTKFDLFIGFAICWCETYGLRFLTKKEYEEFAALIGYELK